MDRVLDMSNETIVWKSVEDEMPDDGIDVLVKTRCASYPVWIGAYDSDEGWRWCDGAMPLHDVTHWAEMPAGPESQIDETGDADQTSAIGGDHGK